MVTFILFLAGFFAGAVNSIASGGALLAFPALLYSGLSPISAAITGYLVVWPGSLSASFKSKKDLKKLPGKYLSLLIPGLAGGFTGILALSRTPSETFNDIIPWLIFATVAIFIFQPSLQKHIKRPAHLRPTVSTALVWAGVYLVCVYAGYFALGAGLILLTLLGFTRIKNIHQMIGLKNLIVFGVTFFAALFFAASEHMAWKQGLIMAAGSVAGGYIGAHFAHDFSKRAIRLLITCLGIIVACVAFIKL